MKLKIKQERENRDWTLKNVATYVKLSIPAIHDIENGRRKPSYDVLVRLEDLFGMSHRELFVPIRDKKINTQLHSTAKEVKSQ